MKNRPALFTNILILLMIIGFSVFMWKKTKIQDTAKGIELTGNLPRHGNVLFAQERNINTAGVIQAIALNDTLLVAASDDRILVYMHNGSKLADYRTGSYISDLCIAGDTLFVLHPGGLSIYNNRLELTSKWEPCSENSYYCGIAVSDKRVFVSDADNKLIVTYTREGDFDGFIMHKNRFVIPSANFPLAVNGDTLYAGNAGAHKIELYNTVNGRFIRDFGITGSAEGAFSGCCNPCGIIISTEGKIITAEKGLARIARFNTDGSYNALLISNKMLNESTLAPKIAWLEDRLVVALGKTITWYKQK